MGSLLEIKELNKDFKVNDETLHVLDNINLEVKEGEFIGLVGFSGCGKSTLLRIISGLETKTSGNITLAGQEIVGPTLDKCMIFQESRLFPWMKIIDNVAYGIDRDTYKKYGKKGARELAKQYIELVQLKGFENAYPAQLSGGMQQRVSIARALISNPKLLLLDEPFGALDAITRIEMQEQVLRIRKENKTTMILVTHDIDEAVYLCDRVVVLAKQPGRVKDIIDVKLPHPRNRTSIEFSELRRKIYKLFFEENSNLQIEYYI